MKTRWPPRKPGSVHRAGRFFDGLMGTAGPTEARQLQTIAQDGESVQSLGEIPEVVVFQLSRDVQDTTARNASGVMVGIHSAVVSGGAITVRQLRRQSAVYQGFKAFVDCSQRDAGNPQPYHLEYFVSIWVAGGAGEKPVDCGTLFGVSVTRGFQGFTKACVGGFGRQIHEV